MSNFILTCESPVDLNNEYMEKRHLPYVPFKVLVNDEEHLDDMGKTFSPWDLYEKLKNGGTSSTSQVSIGDYMDFFENYLKKGEDVLHITLSSGISGTYNSACQAAEALKESYPHNQVIVIDSMAASAGYGLLVDYAADRRDEGMSIEDTADWVEQNKLTINHWFFSNDLTYYIRGGRVSKAAGIVGQALSICPFLNVDYKGRLIPREKVRTKKKVEKRIVEKMEECADNGLDYNDKCFISTSDKEASDRVKELIEERFPQLKGKIQVFDIGCTIGAHTGPGTVALFFKGQLRID